MADEKITQTEVVFPNAGESGFFRMEMYRGEGVNAELKVERGFASDPGDYGRGEYWTDSMEFASTYGNVRRAVVELNNALRLDPKEMVRLIRDEYGITKAWLPHEQRLAAVERFTREMLANGYDGIVVYGYELPGIWSACVFDRSFCPTK
jgi:hypothetical protein